jgi:hypothetical protein
VTVGARQGARAFLEFLGNATAEKSFREFGFQPVPPR